MPPNPKKPAHKESQKPGESRPDLVEHSPLTAVAREVIKLLGLQEAPPPDQDHKQVQLPHDLSVATKQELGYQLGVWTDMLNFAAYQKGLIEVDVKSYSGSIKRKVEDHLDAEKNRSTKVTEKKAAAHRTPEVRTLEEKREKAEAVQLLLQKFVDEFDRNWDTISREISRRAIPDQND